MDTAVRTLKNKIYELEKNNETLSTLNTLFTGLMNHTDLHLYRECEIIYPSSNGT